MNNTNTTATPSPVKTNVAIRKGVEHPKPLKSTSVLHPNNFTSGAEQVLELYGKVAKDLSTKSYDGNLVASIVALNQGLKVYGLQVEQTHKEVLDRYQAFLRNACRDGSLDLVARLQLLEIIELRSMKWKPNENVTNYYKHKLLQVEQRDFLSQHDSDQDGLNANASEFKPTSTANYCASASASLSSLLAVKSPESTIPQGHVMADSGNKLTKVPGKPQLKDDVVIRNADSGKVEAGAKERIVQIIGPDEGQINVAKGLIGETIQRNQTPEIEEEEDNNNESDFKLGGNYSYTVDVGDDSIKILSGNADLVRVAKIVLDEYFAKYGVKLNDDDDCSLSNESSSKVIRYDRRQLLAYSNSPFCRQEPNTWSPYWEALKQENPSLARNVKTVEQVGEERDYFKPSAEHFLHKTPRFPEGFVRRFNSHESQPKVSYLDRLFSAGAAAGDAPAVKPTTLESLLANAQIWDPSKQQWVTEHSRN